MALRCEIDAVRARVPTVADPRAQDLSSRESFGCEDSVALVDFEFDGSHLGVLSMLLLLFHIEPEPCGDRRRHTAGKLRCSVERRQVGVGDIHVLR